MRRILLLAAMLLTAVFAGARDYSPTTTWPYAYPDFAPGYVTIHGGTVKTMIVNINIVWGSLHYLEDDFIKETHDVKAVKIGSDQYVNAVGKLMKVLASSDKGYVVEGVEVDIAALNSTGAAYGSSSTTLGTMNLSSLEGIGATNSSSALNHMEIRANKDSGQILPLIRKKYIFAGGRLVYATKKDVSNAVGAPALKAFLKENKVKWNNAESLLQLLPLFVSE